MIIISIIILYFIQITHIDDFPSTGTRLVVIRDSKIFTLHSVSDSLKLRSDRLMPDNHVG